MDAKVQEELERLFKESPDDVMEWFLTLDYSRWPDMTISSLMIETYTAPLSDSISIKAV